jgi:hypothetical protein
MASDALNAFVPALEEIDELLRADNTPVGGSPTDPAITKVVGRASVVLLSSHFERYFYAINEEAAAYLNAAGVCGRLLPEALRLVHSAGGVDAMVETQWQNRAEQLREFVKSDGWLWTSELDGRLEHKRLLEWMNAPTPKNLVRYYKYWNISDVFGAVTRTNHTRKDLYVKLQELVDKRNNIAHGDRNTEATRGDIRGYEAAARKFCVRADRLLSKKLARMCGVSPPW